MDQSSVQVISIRLITLEDSSGAASIRTLIACVDATAVRQV